MKTKKFLSLALAILFALAIAAGCAPEEDGGPDGTENGGAADTTVTVTDILGRTVTLPRPAERLAGTHNPTMNIAIILGGGGDLIVGFGNTEMADDLYSHVFPELGDVMSIGTGRNINMESVIIANPDLVILPERHSDLVADFEARDIPVAVILPSLESFETIKQSIELLGALTGMEERAAQIIAHFDAKIAAADAFAGRGPLSPKVLFLGSSSQLSVANGAMLQSIMIETVGAVNVAKDVGGSGGFIEVSLEEIIAWNPEVIYVPAYASYTVDDILNDAAWGSIDAVRNGRVYQFPSAPEPWDYPTPSTLMGLGWMLNNLYPDLYSMEQVIADAQEYYQMVYGITFTAEQLGLS